MINAFIFTKSCHRYHQKSFFSDGLLNIYLYSKIGNAQFQRLRRFFCRRGI